MDGWGSSRTRRSFFSVVAATALAVMTPRWARAVSRGDALSRSTYAPALGEEVTLVGPAGTVRATLAEVGDLVGAPAGADGRFSLLFRAPAGAPVSDGPYAVRSRRLGAPSLFLTAVDRASSATLYQAVINRI